jgi:tetratricopeptide (TPR) repeat protein
MALEQRGKFAESAAAWNAFLEAHPANAEAYAHLGFLDARQERYAQAITFYQKALALSPGMPGLRLNLGLSLFKSGQLKAAIDTFAPLLKSDPPLSPEGQRVTALTGMAYFGLGAYREGVPYLRRAADTDPRSLELRLALVQSCLGSKQFQCALDGYNEILQLNAESAEADMVAGELLDEMKDEPGAIEQFRAAVRINPAYPNAHFGLGYMLWKVRRYDEAASEFQAELVNVPESAEALTYLGDINVHHEDAQRAIPLLEKAVALNKAGELGHLDLAIAYAQVSRQEDAFREFKAAESISPNDSVVHYRFGRFLQATGRKEEAKREFDTTRTLKEAADDTVFSRLQALTKPK